MGDEKEVILDETDKYVCVFDPLDGSSNVDAGIPTGTIIGKQSPKSLQNESSGTSSRSSTLFSSCRNI